MSTLRHTHDKKRKLSEVIYNPTRFFYEYKPGQKPDKIAYLDISPGTKSHETVLRPADFVVLDDCTGTLEDFKKVRQRLSDEIAQSTVCLVPDAGFVDDLKVALSTTVVERGDYTTDARIMTL